MKKCVFLIALIILVFFIPLNSFAAETFFKEGKSVTFYNESSWYVRDGVWIEGLEPAQYSGGELFVSLEDFEAAFGCTAYYNFEDTSIYIKYLERDIWQCVGYETLFVDGLPYYGPAPFVSEGGRVMIPAAVYTSVVGYQGSFEVSEDYAPGQLTLSSASTPHILTELEVNKAAQLVTLYGKDPFGAQVPVRRMLCSTGVALSTPNGHFTVKPIGGQWYYFKKFNCYVLYCSQISGNICFHSIQFDSLSYAAVNRTAYSVIGEPASHGCIRLFARDSKFIYQNCGGLPVNIIAGYTDEATDMIRAQILAEKPSYDDYVTMLKSGDY